MSMFRCRCSPSLYKVIAVIFFYFGLPCWLGAQGRISKFFEGVNYWKRTNCPYPDQSFYVSPKTPDPTMPLPALQRCQDVESKPQNERTENDVFLSQLCQTVYFLSEKICSNSSTFQEFSKDALDNSLDFNSLDVCAYGPVLKESVTLKGFIDYFVKGCDQFCKNEMNSVCRLMVSALCQFSTFYFPSNVCKIQPARQLTEKPLAPSPTQNAAPAKVGTGNGPGENSQVGAAATTNITTKSVTSPSTKGNDGSTISENDPEKKQTAPPTRSTSSGSGGTSDAEQSPTLGATLPGHDKSVNTTGKSQLNTESNGNVEFPGSGVDFGDKTPPPESQSKIVALSTPTKEATQPQSKTVSLSTPTKEATQSPIKEVLSEKTKVKPTQSPPQPPSNSGSGKDPGIFATARITSSNKNEIKPALSSQAITPSVAEVSTVAKLNTGDQNMNSKNSGANPTASQIIPNQPTKSTTDNTRLVNNQNEHSRDEDYDLDKKDNQEPGLQSGDRVNVNDRNENINKDIGKDHSQFQTIEENVPGSGHFFAYFLTAVVICISGYVIFHNKQKILAFIVEGRNGGDGRRRGNGNVQYTKLKSNVEEVMPSLDKATSAKNFVY